MKQKNLDKKFRRIVKYKTGDKDENSEDNNNGNKVVLNCDNKDCNKSSNISSPRNLDNIPTRKTSEPVKKKSIKIIFIIVPIVLILIGVVIAIYFLFIKKTNAEISTNCDVNSDSPQNDPLDNKNDNKEDDTDNIETEPTERIIIIENPKFQRITIDKKSKDNILVEGMNETIYLYKKNIYDVYNYKEYGPGNENGINYSKKFTYSILLMKRCLNTENEIDNCELEENDPDTRNLILRNLDNNENNIPLCLINKTDEDIILSVKCSKTFDEDIKLEIISDSKYLIRNNASNNENNNIASCGYNCYEKKDIINNNGSVYHEILSRNKSISNIDGYINTIEINAQYKDIEKDKDLYYEAIEKNDFGQIENIKKSEKEEIINEVKDDNNNGNDNDNDNDNYNDINLFKKDILDHKIALKNRIEFNDGVLKAYLIVKINNLKKNILYLNKSFELNKIKNHNSDITNINNITNELIKNIKDKLEMSNDNITQNFNNLNELIYKKNFDDFINVINNKKINGENFKNTLNLANQNLKEILDKVNEDNQPNSEKIKLKMTEFINNSSELINNILETMNNLKNSVNSQDNNIYTKISNYYFFSSYSFIELIQQVENLCNNYYIYESEKINEGINIFKQKFFIENKTFDMDGIDKYFNLDDIESIKNEIKKLNDIPFNITKNIGDYFENQINSEKKQNGYFRTEEEINNIQSRYINIKNQLSNAISNLNINNDIIFDELMINFKDNFTNILRYLEDEKNKQFPLNENILKDDFFSPEEENRIKNIIETNSNEIINLIKKNNNLYLMNITKEIEDFLNNNIEELNSLIFEIKLLCSDSFLQELSQSLEDNIIKYLNEGKNNLKLYLDDYINYFENNRKILENNKAAIITSKEVNKDFIASIENIKNYINNQLYSDLSEEYSNILNGIKDMLFIIIKNCKLDKKYEQINELSFINENINDVNDLYERIKEYFSQDKFNNKYKGKLKNYHEELKNYINEKYNIINSKPKTGDCNKWQINVKFESGDEQCIDVFNNPNEDVNSIFSEINSDNNFKIFKNKIDYFYSSLNQSIISYKSTIEIFFSSLSKIEKQLNSQKEILNFSLLNDKINSLLSEKFEENLINKCYDYYKSNTNDNIENILNEFLSRINNTFDNLADKIAENGGKFKTSLTEFGMMAIIYENLITQNITRNYFDLIIDNQKNNFNYSVSYYYNRFLNLINSTRNNIIKSLPINKYGLNIYIEEYKKEINNKFNEFIIKINNSKKEYLNIDRQVYTLNVPRTNFFKVNSILSTNVLLSRNLLEEKRLAIQSLDNDKSNTNDMLIAKFYLEDSNIPKQIEEIYNITYGDIETLNKEKFEEIINDTFEFDKIGFINKLNILLYNLNLENEKEFFKLKKNLTKLFEDEFDKYLIENKNGILDKIKNLYNQFKFSENNIEEIYGSINEILDKIKFHLDEEKQKIENKSISFNDNFDIIKQQLDEYKNEIINTIENKINNYVNDYKEEMITIVYKNKVEFNLNKYLEEIQKYTKDYEDKNLLNSSYNFGKTIENIIENLINKYKNLTKKFIDYENKMKLIDIINKDKIEKLIKNTIDSEYNNLLSILNKYQNNSTDKVYDFSTPIKEDIKSVIDSKLINIQNIISSLYSYNLLRIKNCVLPDLNISKISDIISIKNKSFESFFAFSSLNEEDKLNDLLKNIAITYFNISINNTFSLYGIDFFERYMKYNEIFKNSFFTNNIKYSLVQILLYYQLLYEFKNNNHILPKDLVNIIHKVNDIDKRVENKKNSLLEIIKNQAIKFKEETKADIIQKYIYELKNDSFIKNNFNNEIYQKINLNMNKIINNKYFEDIYDSILENLLENLLKEKIIEENSKKLNILLDELIKLIESQKKEIKNKIQSNSQDNNEEIKNRDKYNENLLKNISNNNSFNITYLAYNISNNYNQKINSNNNNYNLENIIKNSKNNIINAVKDYIRERDNSLVINNNKINEKFSSMKNDLTIIKNSIINYSKNLNANIRRLDANINNDEHNSKNKDSNFQKVIQLTERNKNFINNYDYNSNSDNIINNFNNSYKNCIESIEKENYGNDIKNNILEQLSKSNEKYIQYMNNIKEILYNKAKELNESTNEINKLILNESENEQNIIYIKKESIKEEYNKIKNQNKDMNIPIDFNLTDYIENYMIKIRIINNKNISFNENLEDDNFYNPKIFVNLNEQIKIEKVEIEISHESGNYKVYLTVDFNINKYKIDIQKCNLDTNNNFTVCSNKTNSFGFETKTNKDINLLNN